MLCELVSISLGLHRQERDSATVLQHTTEKSYSSMGIHTGMTVCFVMLLYRGKCLWENIFVTVVKLVQIEIFVEEICVLQDT